MTCWFIFIKFTYNFFVTVFILLTNCSGTIGSSIYVTVWCFYFNITFCVRKFSRSIDFCSRLEVGDFYPSLSTFLRIVEILNVDINDFAPTIKYTDNKIRTKLIKILYNSTDEELSFYDRLITFAQDEIAELKKNLTLKKFK